MPVVRDALQRGQRVRMTVTGSSMFPFVCDNDVVELESAPAPRLGDIALVRHQEQNGELRYVLHRVVRIDRRKRFFIKGDAQAQREGPLMPDRFLGRVATVWHGGRAHAPDRGLRRVAAFAWMWTGPLGPALFRGALLLSRPLRCGWRRLRATGNMG